MSGVGPVYRSVDELSAPPSFLLLVIQERSRQVPPAAGYVVSGGLTRFFEDFFTPLAKAINCAVPASAVFPSDVPSATRDFLQPHVAKLLSMAVSFLPPLPRPMQTC